MDSAKSYPRSFVAVVLLTIASYLTGALWVVLIFFGLLGGFLESITIGAVFNDATVHAYGWAIIADIFAGTICALIAFILGVHRQFWTVAIFAMLSSIVGCAGSLGILLG